MQPSESALDRAAVRGARRRQAWRAHAFRVDRRHHAAARRQPRHRPHPHRRARRWGGAGHLVRFEEPTLPDDHDAYARMARATGMPLAMGGNLHTMRELEEAFARSTLAWIQRDASHCGSLTGWLGVHAFPVDDDTRRPLVVEQHMAVAPSTAGTGVQFDREKLAPLEVGLA